MVGISGFCKVHSVHTQISFRLCLLVLSRIDGVIETCIVDVLSLNQVIVGDHVVVVFHISTGLRVVMVAVGLRGNEGGGVLPIVMRNNGTGCWFDVCRDTWLSARRFVPHTFHRHLYSFQM